jgi:hypothetical protein
MMTTGCSLWLRSDEVLHGTIVPVAQASNRHANNRSRLLEVDLRWEVLTLISLKRWTYSHLDVSVVGEEDGAETLEIRLSNHSFVHSLA